MREFEDGTDATAAGTAPAQAMPAARRADQGQPRDSAAARELLRRLLADRLRLLAELEAAPASGSSDRITAALRGIEEALAADDLRPAWRAVETGHAQASGHAALAGLLAFGALAREVLPMTKEGRT